MWVALVALLSYLSTFLDKIVLFIISANLYFENDNKCFNELKEKNVV